MKKLSLLLALIFCSSALYAKEKGYPDMNEGKLGPEETAALKAIEGKWKRPHYSYSDPKFKKDWDEITSYKVPEWLLDAKFGMYTHWGIYSIPAHRGNTYMRYMYTPKGKHGKESKAKGADYYYHKKTYGDPAEFGYTDFIPMFKCEDYSGEAYVKLMQDTGARFGGLCVVHHDGFLMWDSKVNRWNVGQMGPKRDIYGEFVKAARKADFRTCATFHHARSFGFAFKDFDEDFYTDEQKKKLDLLDPEKSDFFVGQPCGKVDVTEFARQWHLKVREVIDKYQPDLLWFDGINRHNPNSPEVLVVDALKHYLKQGNANGQKPVLCNKLPGGDRQNIPWYNFPENTGIRCYEAGRNMPPNAGDYWLADRAISYPWSYTHTKTYNLGSEIHIRAMVDWVSRGGIYLLSLTPMASGKICDKEMAICKGIGAWLKVNGEAIYKTRRWKIPAEGPISQWKLVEHREGIMWNSKRPCKEGEFRFTQSKDGKTVYALMMAWPKSGKAVIKSFKTGSDYHKAAVESVDMIGSAAKLEWKQTDKGLEITLPKAKPCDYVYSFRIK